MHFSEDMWIKGWEINVKGKQFHILFYLLILLLFPRYCLSPRKVDTPGYNLLLKSALNKLSSHICLLLYRTLIAYWCQTSTKVEFASEQNVLLFVCSLVLYYWCICSLSSSWCILIFKIYLNFGTYGHCKEKKTFLNAMKLPTLTNHNIHSIIYIIF
jgi:hypothetical protein